MMTFAQEFQLETRLFRAQVKSAVKALSYVELPAKPKPMMAPFNELEIIAIGDGFTLRLMAGLWELRRGGIFIARFCEWIKAVKCAADLRFCFDCWDIETSFTVIERYGGITL